MPRRTEVLKGIPLFQGLSARHLRRVRDLADEMRFMGGHSVVRAGDPGDTLFVILEGQAKVVGRNGRVVTRLLPGDFFGEVSLLDGGVRTASVVSETPLVMLAIGRRPLFAAIEQEPEIALRMLRELAGRLRRAERPISG